MPNPKRVLGGIKTAFTRKVEEADQYMGEAREYSVKDEAKISDMITGLKAHIERSENKFYDELTEAFDDADYPQAEQDFNDHIGKAKKCVESMYDYLEAQRKKIVTNDSTENTPQEGVSNNIKSNISDTLRPSKLQRSWNLEEFNDWSDKFQAWFADNDKTLQKKGLAYQRQLLHTVLDARTIDDLRTCDEVNQDTAILGQGGCLSKIKDIFLKEFPLHVRRYKYLKYTQEVGQPFDEWWVQKKKLARNCELDKVTAEEMTLLGLMTGIRDPKLKEEFLRVEEPTTAALVKLAESKQNAERHAGSLNPSPASIYQTSAYKTEKKNLWDHEHQQSRPPKPTNGKFPECKYCGYRKCKGGKFCPAVDKKCLNCEIVGHFARVCSKEKSRNENPPTGKSGGQPEVRSKRVTVYKVQSARDDNEPVPTAKMKIIPSIGKKPFDFEVFPDQGATQSLVAHDVARKYGMKIDPTGRKAVEDAQGGKMQCSGVTSFDVEYEGNKTRVQALVSKSLKNECLLGWRALQRLNIIHENFPHVLNHPTVRTVAAKATKSGVSLEGESTKSFEKSEISLEGESTKSFDDPIKENTKVSVRNINCSKSATTSKRLLKNLTMGRMTQRLFEETNSWKEFRQALKKHRNLQRQDTHNARRREEVKKAKKDQCDLPPLTMGQLEIIQDPKTLQEEEDYQSATNKTISLQQGEDRRSTIIVNPTEYGNHFNKTSLRTRYGEEKIAYTGMIDVAVYLLQFSRPIQK